MVISGRQRGKTHRHQTRRRTKLSRGVKRTEKKHNLWPLGRAGRDDQGPGAHTGSHGWDPVHVGGNEMALSDRGFTAAKILFFLSLFVVIAYEIFLYIYIF